MRRLAKDRALWLKDRAFELVTRQGAIERIPNHGIARAYLGSGLRVWYTDPETSECDEYHHLDVWDSERKVLSVVWLSGAPPQVVSFKRGNWETLFFA
jgi:hypothetical protein